MPEELMIPITTVCRTDVLLALNLTPEQAQQIDKDLLEEIAHRMEDDYMEQLYWSSLRIIGEKCLRDRGIL